jgi:hypothetical protein
MKFGWLVCGLLMFTTLETASQTQPKPEALAQQSADSWLALVDSGKYAESWQDASQLFKAHVNKGQWETAARATRSPLGPVQSRQLKSATLKTSLPGVPDGQYVVLQYETSFEHKRSAIETVTPMLDKDEAWRVSGYYIR